jgi:cytochrome c biogenesis protein CcmG, thiol:disulfide interchange protein DsbE
MRNDAGGPAVTMRAMPALRRLTLLVGLALLACDAHVGAANRPGFRLPTLDGKRLGPADFKGKVVVIDFWATWCGPCYLQADILHRLQAQYPKADVQFLAIDVGEDEKTVRAFVAKRPIPYPVLLDEQERVSGDLGVSGFPTLLILDRKGEVSYLRAGIVPDRRLRDLLARAGLPQPKAAPTPTPVGDIKPALPAAAKPVDTDRP